MRIEDPAAYQYILTDDLYLLDSEKTLHAPLPGQPAQPEDIPDAFNYTGGNKKNYLVLSLYTNEEYMATRHQAALESTLHRLGYTTDDFALLNMHRHTDIHIDQLTHHFKPQKLLVLGSDALPAGLTTNGFNTVTSNGTYKTLVTYSFGDMMDDTNKKKVFWEQVKQL